MTRTARQRMILVQWSKEICRILFAGVCVWATPRLVMATSAGTEDLSDGFADASSAYFSDVPWDWAFASLIAVTWLALGVFALTDTETMEWHAGRAARARSLGPTRTSLNDLLIAALDGASAGAIAIVSALLVAGASIMNIVGYPTAYEVVAFLALLVCFVAKGRNDHWLELIVWATAAGLTAGAVSVEVSPLPADVVGTVLIWPLLTCASASVLGLGYAMMRKGRSHRPPRAPRRLLRSLSR